MRWWETQAKTSNPQVGPRRPREGNPTLEKAKEVLRRGQAAGDPSHETRWICSRLLARLATRPRHRPSISHTVNTHGLGAVPTVDTRQLHMAIFAVSPGLVEELGVVQKISSILQDNLRKCWQTGEKKSRFFPCRIGNQQHVEHGASARGARHTLPFNSYVQRVAAQPEL